MIEIYTQCVYKIEHSSIYSVYKKLLLKKCQSPTEELRGSF